MYLCRWSIAVLLCLVILTGAASARKYRARTPREVAGAADAVSGAIGRSVGREEEIALEGRRELEEDGIVEELSATPHEILLGRIARLIVEGPEDSARLVRTWLVENRQPETR